jgi:hypothetical protein
MRGALFGVGALAAVAILAGFWWWACTGPRAEIEEVSLEAPHEPGHPYQAQAVVHNRGRNQGEVTVVFRLVGADGSVFTEEENVPLEGHDRVTVVAEISAPPGEYEVEAKVLYPPR